MNSGSYQTSRMAEVRHVLWIVLLLNLLVALAKFFYGLATNSHSMQADGIHSVFDSMGNVVGLVGITLALRPADEGHPYGHFKFETYASMVIGVLLIVAAFEVGSSAISALISGDHNASVTVVSYVVMVGTLCINIGVTTYERRAGKRLNSDILLADASHTLSDAMVSIGVIVGLVLIQLGFAIADSVMALVVMVAILYTAFDVLLFRLFPIRLESPKRKSARSWKTSQAFGMRIAFAHVAHRAMYMPICMCWLIRA